MVSKFYIYPNKTDSHEDAKSQRVFWKSRVGGLFLTHGMKLPLLCKILRIYNSTKFPEAENVFLSFRNLIAVLKLSVTYKELMRRCSIQISNFLIGS